MNQQKNLNIKITPKELKNILQEYEPDMMRDEEEFYRYKEAMGKLEKSDLIIFVLYSELQSERKVAELLGVSRSPIHKLIMKIKNQILENVGHNV